MEDASAIPALESALRREQSARMQTQPPSSDYPTPRICMTRYLRVVRQRRWATFPDIEWIAPGETQADALLDLQTKDNRLSVFRVDNDIDIQRVVIALAATRDHVANLDYAIFDDDELIARGIDITRTVGETPDQTANTLHHDIHNPDGATNRVPSKNHRLRSSHSNTPQRHSNDAERRPAIRRFATRRNQTKRLDSNKLIGDIPFARLSQNLGLPRERGDGKRGKHRDV